MDGTYIKNNGRKKNAKKNIKLLGSWSLDRGGVSTYCLLDPLVVFELASFGCELAGGGGGGIGVPWPPSIPNPVASLKDMQACYHWRKQTNVAKALYKAL